MGGRHDSGTVGAITPESAPLELGGHFFGPSQSALLVYALPHLAHIEQFELFRSLDT
jgi:hypothetical protein